MASKCKDCVYFDRIPQTEHGDCYLDPPRVWSVYGLPVAEQPIFSRPQVLRTDKACSHFTSGPVSA